MSEILQKETPKFLYHYTSVNSLALILQNRTALVHKSRRRRNPSICLDWLGNLVGLRHTQVRHFVESGATD